MEKIDLQMTSNFELMNPSNGVTILANGQIKSNPYNELKTSRISQSKKNEFISIQKSENPSSRSQFSIYSPTYNYSFSQKGIMKSKQIKQDPKISISSLEDINQYNNANANLYSESDSRQILSNTNPIIKLHTMGQTMNPKNKFKKNIKIELKPNFVSSTLKFIQGDIEPNVNSDQILIRKPNLSGISKMKTISIGILKKV